MSLRAVVTLAGSASPSPSLSQSSPTSPLPGENDPTWLGPGLLGFLSLVFLAVAVFFIYRSLNKQLGRVTFDEDTVNATAAEPGTVPRAVETSAPAASASDERAGPE